MDSYRDKEWHTNFIRDTENNKGTYMKRIILTTLTVCLMVPLYGDSIAVRVHTSTSHEEINLSISLWSLLKKRLAQTQVNTVQKRKKAPCLADSLKQQKGHLKHVPERDKNCYAKMPAEALGAHYWNTAWMDPQFGSMG